MMPTIAVTGVGAVIGHGVLKSIRCSGTLQKSRIIGMDMNPDSVGFLECDEHYISRKVSAPGYLEELLDICRNEKVDLLIPMIEDEFIPVDENIRQFTDTGTRVLLQPRGILDKFMDKYFTAIALKEAGLPTPETVLFLPENEMAISDLAEQHGYPLFAKPRRGRSSKGQVIINSKKEMMMYLELLKDRNYVIQEFLSEDDEEYTCCVFKTQDMPMPYFIALKRRLLNGTTVSAEVVFDDSLEDMGGDIARCFPVNGSLNIQVRKKKGIPHIFEINPRYSSTAYMRALCGFNDVEMGIEYAMGHHIGDMPRISKCKIIRYFEESCISYS